MRIASIGEVIVVLVSARHITRTFTLQVVVVSVRVLSTVFILVPLLVTGRQNSKSDREARLP